MVLAIYLIGCFITSFALGYLKAKFLIDRNVVEPTFILLWPVTVPFYSVSALGKYLAKRFD